MTDWLHRLHPLDWTVLLVYFFVIVAVGVWVGRFTRTTNDFFFAGQRFSWWMVAFSCVATLVGSYSFAQYSESSFKYGFSFLNPYTNEWFVLPIFLGAWLPIIYYNRLQSIPEYFERRFDRRTRIAVLIVMLIYLEVYIGVNLWTMGRIVLGLFDWPTGPFNVNLIFAAGVLAILSGIYLHAGGQTSVMVTDLLQGMLLLSVGLGVFALGVYQLGGFERLWEGLPDKHRLPFGQFNRPTGYHAVGDFWNDAIVGTFAFYMINQGILMRFLSARSVADGRKAMLVVVVVLMPLAALAVTGAGLVGRAMQTHQVEPLQNVTQELESLQDDPEQLAVYEDETAKNMFVTVARGVCGPGLFGLVIAAIVAALMSSLDTYITAVSAVAINDVWRPLRPGRDDAYYLKAARTSAILVTVLGLALIPVFEQYDTIYQALSMFTSLIIPPLAVVICLAILWPHFSARAAFYTIVSGSVAMLASLMWPQLIEPLSHGVDPGPYHDILQVLGIRSVESSTVSAQPPWEVFPYLRGLFGLIVSSLVALVLGLRDARRIPPDHRGLVAGSLDRARERFKGSAVNEQGIGMSLRLKAHVDTALKENTVRLPREIMQRLHVEAGDILHVSDSRWWLGGFRSAHATVADPDEEATLLAIAPDVQERGHLNLDRHLRIEKLM